MPGRVACGSRSGRMSADCAFTLPSHASTPATASLVGYGVSESMYSIAQAPHGGGL